MPKGYWIARVDVSDPDRYRQYVAANAKPFMAPGPDAAAVPEYGSAAYPKPIVDERTAVAFAKEKLYGLRKTQAAHTEAQVIQNKHGSRKSGLPPSGSRPASTTAGSSNSAPKPARSSRACDPPTWPKPAASAASRPLMWRC